MKGKRFIIVALAAFVLLWMIPRAFKPAAVQGAALEAPHWGVGGVPQFKIDPSWPKIPSKWKVGFGSDVFGDSKGNVWILSRPRRLPKGSPAAPPVMEFDQAGNFVQGWGGESGPGYQWPSERSTDSSWIAKALCGFRGMRTASRTTRIVFRTTTRF